MKYITYDGDKRHTLKATYNTNNCDEDYLRSLCAEFTHRDAEAAKQYGITPCVYYLAEPELTCVCCPSGLTIYDDKLFIFSFYFDRSFCSWLANQAPGSTRYLPDDDLHAIFSALLSCSLSESEICSVSRMSEIYGEKFISLFERNFILALRFFF